MKTWWPLLLFLIELSFSQRITPSSIQVRLVNGIAGVSGRVEVRRNSSEVWGTVCDDLWGDLDATVVCRMIGSLFGVGKRYATYGQGTGPILMDNVQCRGSETNLAQCQFQGWGVHNCRHYEDAGVECTNNSVVLTSVGRISYNRPSPVSNVGAVQIRVPLGLVPVCDSGWNDSAASVVCRSLGHVSGKSYCCSRLSPFINTPSIYPRVAYTNFSCSGSENKLLDCTYSNTTTCARGHMASVICYDKPLNQVIQGFSVEIVNGSSDGSWGRVEVTYMEVRGQICGTGFNDAAAKVICKQKGYQGGGVLLGGPSWSYTNNLPIWINAVNCTGQEHSIKDCAANPMGTVSSNCRPIHVLCTSQTHGLPTLHLVGGGMSYGRVQITFNGVNGTVCDNSWSGNDARTVCKALGYVDGTALRNSYYGAGTGPVFMDYAYCAGGESSLWQCRTKRGWNSADSACDSHTKDAGVSCFRNVRLSLGDHSNGVVSISQRYRTYTRWLPVCGRGFTRTDARVVCRELGFQNGRVLPRGAYGKYYQVPYVRRSINCRGRERSILNCTYSRRSCPRYSYTGYASVHCYNGTLPTAKSISLAGAVTAVANFTGRVVVHKYGIQNGRICSGYWDDGDANVACHQLGFRGGVSYQYYSVGSGPFLMSAVNCRGNETSLFNCRSGVEACSPITNYLSDAGVLCYRRNAPYVDLVGGSTNRGRVELVVDGLRGTVCVGGNKNYAAKVVCIQKGFRDGTFSTEFGAGSAEVAMSYVSCTGAERSLFQCRNVGWRTPPRGGYCQSHRNDLGVICFGNVKLVSGISRHNFTYGRVLYNRNGRWVPICSTGFDTRDAQVVCRELGFPYYRRLRDGAFGSSYFYTYISSVNCTGSEPSIRNCSYTTRGCRRRYPYTNYGSVACSLTPFSESITTSFGSTFPSVVFIQKYGINTTVCSAGWDDRDANVACREKGYSGGYAVGSSYSLSGLPPKWFTSFNCTGNELRLTDCSYSQQPSLSCQSSYMSARIFCYNVLDALPGTSPGFQLRLARPDGAPIGRGRVEMAVNGRWGTVCDSYFSTSDARVVCKQLGFPDGRALPRNSAGAGRGQPWLYSVRCSGSEKAIWQCRFSQFNSSYSRCVTHQYDAAVQCTGNVRLSPNVTYGAIQVRIGNTNRYSLICADNFTHTNARVICQEMGYSYGISICCSAFGRQFYSIGVTNLRCTGQESRVRECPQDTSLTYCPSMKYASAACSNTNPRTGYDIAIGSGRASSNNGIVKISHMNIWGTMCPNGFDNNAATVVCREKQFAGGFAYVYPHYHSYSARHLRWLSNVKCDGTETYFQGCRGVIFGDIADCKSFGDAAVYCYNNASLGIQFRLANKTGNSGRVEMAIDGVWGTICADYSFNNDANVLCKKFGYIGGRAAGTGRGTFGRGSGPVYIDNMRCTGNETDVSQCPMNVKTRYLSYYCRRHRYDAAITCFNDARLVDSNNDNFGRVEMFRNNQWTPVCDDHFNDITARVVCKSIGFVDGRAVCCSALGPITASINVTINSCTGSETTLKNCQTSSGCQSGKYATVYCSRQMIPNNNPAVVRMQPTRYTSASYKGSIEINKYGFWGPVCDKKWTDAAANVTCKSMNWNGGISYTTYIYSSKPLVISSVQCTGQERNITSCTVNGFGAGNMTCAYPMVRRGYYGTYSVRRKSAGVLCYLRGISLRLVGGGQNYGRIVINYDGTDGRVCNTYFDNRDANVVCRQLGYKSGIYSFYNSRGRGRVWVNYARCKGTETSFFKCRKSWYTNYRNGYCRDASVICYNTVRLIRGNRRSFGILEVNYNGNWGGVCNKNWNTKDTQTACRELGYQNGFYLCCGALGDHYQPIMDNVRCTGRESNFANCPHDSPLSKYCLGKNVGLACYNGTPSTEFSWKLGGGNNYTGEVLVNFTGIMGRICPDSWDDTDATVACKELGFSKGKAYTHYRFNFYYSNNGAYWTSNIGCTGNETSLADCRKTQLGHVTQCSTSHSAGLMCFDEAGIFYQLAGGTDNSGRVEVSFNGVWGSVCTSYFDYREANVLCRTLGYSDGVVDYGKTYPNPNGPVYDVRFLCTGSESKLSDCPHGAWQQATGYCRNHRHDVAVTCYGMVRLGVGYQSNKKQGPVQIYNNGSWSLLCDTGFTDVSAKRVCKDLGFVDGKAICCSAYGTRYFRYYYSGRSANRITLNSTMSCQGGEQSAVDCLIPNSCQSNEYASVVCQNDTDVIDESYVFDFENPNSNHGMIKVLHYGVKGRICNTFWGDEEAKAFCRKKGYPDGIAYHYSATFNYMPLQRRGPFWVSAMNCTGSENGLATCPYNTRLNLGNCSYADISSAICLNQTSGISYRLAGGGDNYGRVEISVGGVWGTVCDSYWDNREAGVLCRTLGYSGGYALRHAYYGRGSGPMWLSGLHCKGTETNIHQCPHSGFNGQVIDDSSYFLYGYCRTHRHDASVYCVDKVRLNLGLNASQGAVEIYENNKWNTVCDDSFDNNDAQVVCRTLGYTYGTAISGSRFGKTAGSIGITNVNCLGNEAAFKKCTYSVSATCSGGKYASVVCSDTQIVDRGWNITIIPDDPVAPNHGRLAVNINGIWGSVCQAGFGQTAASVACRELGYAGGVSYRPPNSRRFMPIIMMTELSCTGNEASLKDCSYQQSTTKSWCDYYAPRAGVLCYSKNNNIRYRLTGDNSRSDRGRIEMLYSNQWGVFCDLYTSYTAAARVACRSVGYSDGLYAPGTRYKYQADAIHPPIWYFYVRCQGNESTLTDCITDGFNNSASIYRRYWSTYCQRLGPLSASCYKQSLKVTNIRLVNPFSNETNMGRVEVFLQGPNEWGTVCDDLWDNIDATVVCNQLGYAKGVARHRAGFGKGGNIWMDDVSCKGTEMRIQDCPFNGIGIHDCSNSEDAGVICSGVLPSTTTSKITSNPTTATKQPPNSKPITGHSETPVAAIVVPVVLVVVAAIIVVAFVMYRRVHSRKEEMNINLVEQDPVERPSIISFRKAGAYFSKNAEASSSVSEVEGVSNPGYDISHVDAPQ